MFFILIYGNCLQPWQVLLLASRTVTEFKTMLKGILVVDEEKVLYWSPWGNWSSAFDPSYTHHWSIGQPQCSAWGPTPVLLPVPWLGALTGVLTLTYMSFDDGRRKPDPAETHTNMGKTFKLYITPGQGLNPGPSCCEATMLTTEPPCCCSGQESGES